MNKELDRFSLWSKKKVQGQWLLYCLVYTLTMGTVVLSEEVFCDLTVCKSYGYQLQGQSSCYH
jgi:hypothetical protein